MKFDTKNLNPGMFFPFEEDGEDGVTVRLASGDALENIEKKCVKKKIEYRRNQRFEVIDEDNERKSSMLWDYVIVDWKGVTDQDDKEIECTRENKRMLMQNSTKFSVFVGKCIGKLTEEMEAYEEDLEKNLLK